MRLSRGEGEREGAGEERYSSMKLLYMCRAGFKNGRLKERPLTENEGLSERPLTGKTGDFGAKNNKETYILFKMRGLFDLPRSEKRYKELYIFEKGVFWSGPGRKSRGFRSGKGRKMGGIRAAHIRTVLILE